MGETRTGRSLELLEPLELEATTITDMVTKLHAPSSVDSVDIDLDDESLPAYPAGHDSLVLLPAESARIGRFTVLRRIGAGGMGVVLSAYDEVLDRKVAIKVVHPHTSDASRGMARMRREAQAMARVSHPNVVQIYEVGHYQEQLFIAMEFVQGQTLDAWHAAGQASASPGEPVRPRPWREILAKHVQAGRGLAAAHAAGLVHRDYKPSNVLVSRDGRARVLDFGLVRRGGEAAPGEDDEQTFTSEHDMRDSLADMMSTDDGLIGTPAYMSTEQFAHQAVDARSDQFSFCVALHEALYGVHPYASETTAARLLRIMQNDVVPAPADTDVPAWVHEALLRGLRYDPRERWPSMAALLDALAQEPAREAEDAEAVLWQSRHGLMLGAAAFLVTAMGLLLFHDHLQAGSVTPTAPLGALLVALAISGVFGAVVVAGRRTLLASQQGRQLMACIAVTCGGIVLTRMIPLFLPVPFEHGFVYGQSLVACMAAAGAITLMRPLLWVAGLWLLLIPLTLWQLEHAPVLQSLGLLATCALGLRYWTRQSHAGAGASKAPRARVTAGPRA